MNRWIEIIDPKGVPTSSGTLAYGAKVEYPYFGAIALIGTSRARWCDPPKPTTEIFLPEPPVEAPKEEEIKASERDKEIRTALAEDNYNKMRSVLSKYSDKSTVGLKKPVLRASLKALLG